MQFDCIYEKELPPVASVYQRAGLDSPLQVGTAVAALALGGVAAGFLLWRMVFRKKHPKKGPQHQETGNTGARKELRRKRPDPHTGYVLAALDVCCLVL